MSGVISDNTVRSSGAIAPLTSATTDANDPAIDTNPTDGLGTKWINTTTGQIWICIDATTDNNKWQGQEAGYVAPSRAVAGGVIISGASGTTDIQYIEIETLGNAVHFGDLTQARAAGATDNGTSGRGIFMGGNRPDPTPGDDIYSNVIDYVTIDTPGNATDFGNLTTVRSGVSGTSDGSRGVFGGGDEPPNNRVNKIDYITIATTGNATTFGTLTVGRSHPSATSNGARGIFAGGHTGSEYTDTIDYITIATTGNAIDFGNLSASQSADIVACSGD